MRHGRGNGDNNSIVFGSKYPAAVLGLNKAFVCLEQWSSPAQLNLTLPAKTCEQSAVGAVMILEILAVKQP